LWQKVSKKLRFALVQQVKAATFKWDKFFLPVLDQFINLRKKKPSICSVPEIQKSLSPVIMCDISDLLHKQCPKSKLNLSLSSP
jgi:hypothetical protein